MLDDALSGIRLKVTVDSETYDSDLRPGDLVRYERHTGKSLFGNADDAEMEAAAKAVASGDEEAIAKAGNTLARMGMGMEDLFFLAYLGVRRQVSLADFDDFLDRVTDVSIGDSESVGKAESPT